MGKCKGCVVCKLDVVVFVVIIVVIVVVVEQHEQNSPFLQRQGQSQWRAIADGGVGGKVRSRQQLTAAVNSICGSSS